MTAGLDRFRDYFAGYQDHYAVIGGTACHLIMDEVGLTFRSTKDIDMVLCVGVVGQPFAERIKAFLAAGGYAARQRSGRREFYRFHEPNDPAFPTMIELFARDPGTIDLADGQAAAPVPVDDEPTSLSAILLDPDYHAALVENRRTVDGVTVLDERLLIPFKARAHVDLARRREAGERVSSREVGKHAKDVFRLLQLLPPASRVDVVETIRGDLRAFVERVEADGSLDPSSFDATMSLRDGLDSLRRIYALR